MSSERLARAGAVSLLGSAFSAGAALLLTVIVGRGLGAHGTGIFFQAIGLFTIASQVLRLGTSSGLTKFLAEQKAFNRLGEATRILLIALIPTVLFSIVASALILQYAQELSTFFSSAEDQADLYVVIVMLTPFLGVAATLGVLHAAVRMLRGVVMFTLLQNVLLPLGRLGLVALAVVAGWGVTGSLQAWVISLPFWLVVTCGLLVGPLIRDWRARRSVEESWVLASGRFWRFSWPRGISAALEIGLDWSDILIVAAIRTPTEAGIYAVVTRAVKSGQIVDRAMRVAVSPTISVLLSKGEVGSARNLHTSVTRAMVLATWPFYLTLIVMAPAVLNIFGSGFSAGSSVLMVLSAVMMLAAAAGMLQSILLMGGRSSWQMYNKALALGLSIGLNLLLVPLWGIMGAAATWAIVVSADTGIAAWQVHRRMGVQLQPRRLLRAGSVPLVIFGGFGSLIRIAFGDSATVLILFILILGLAYLMAMWLMRRSLGIEGLWSTFSVKRSGGGTGKDSTKQAAG